MNYLRAKIKRIIKIMKFDVSGVSTTHRQAQCKRSTTGIRLRSTTLLLNFFAWSVFEFSITCKLSFFSVTLCLGDFVFSTECNLSLISLLSASVPQSLCVLEKNQRINTIFPNSFLK